MVRFNLIFHWSYKVPFSYFVPTDDKTCVTDDKFAFLSIFLQTT